MARINRYSRRTPYEGSLYEMPIELIARTLDFTQKRYDQNKDIADEIKDFSIPSLPQDRERANQLQKQYADEVDATVAEYSGNYAKASNKLKELTRKIKRDFNPGGEANAISGNYNNYNTWLKNSQELVEKGKALGQDLNLANSYHMKNYSGIGEFDPVKGQYNQFNPETLSEYADMEANIQKSFSTFKPEKHKVGRTSFVNGKIVYNEEETEGITADRLTPSFQQILATDPKVTGYLSQRAKYLGLSPKDTQDYISNFATQRAKDLAYMSSSDINKATRDPMSLLYARAKIAEDAKKKEQVEQRALRTTESSVGIPNRVQADIDPNNWRSTFGNYDINKAVDPLQREPGFLGNTTYTGGKDKYQDKTLLDVMFTEDFKYTTRMDPTLMKALWSQMSSKNPRAYVDNYGKNQTWTAEFERSFLTAYKNAEKDHKFVAPVTWDIPQPAARAQIVKHVAGSVGMNPENVRVMKFGTNVSMTAAAADLTPEDFMYKIGDKTVFADDVKVAISGPGTGGIGHLIQTKKGAFVFIDDNESRNLNNLPLNHAAQNLFFEGKEKTDAPVDMIFQGKQINTYMGRTIVADKNGRTHEILYAMPMALDKEGRPVLDKNGNVQLLDKNKYKPQDYIVDWRDTQNLYIGKGIEGLSGMGQTKSQGTWYDMMNDLMTQKAEQDYDSIIDQAVQNQE